MEPLTSADDLVNFWIIKSVARMHQVDESTLSNPKMTTTDSEDGFNYSTYTYQEGSPATLELSADCSDPKFAATLSCAWMMDEMPDALLEIAALRSSLVVWK